MRMRIRAGLLVATLSVLSIATAGAEPPVAPELGGYKSTSEETYAVLTRLQEQQAIVAAQVKLAEQRKQLAELNKSIDSLNAAEVPGTEALPQPGAGPVVLRIEGSPGALRAILLTSDGLLEVRSGETIASVGRIVAIDHSGVRVVQRGVQHVIAFAAAPKSSSNSSADSDARGVASGAYPLAGNGFGGLIAPPVPLSPPVRSQ